MLISGKTLILPPQMREGLKKPWGEVISNSEEVIFKEGKTIICVGDKTSERILKLGISPKLCIYDGKTNRKEIGISSFIKNFKAQLIQVKNPAGELNKNLVRKIAEGLKAKRSVKIQVEGEEDLATLAAIHLSPLNSVVLYGQPSQGLVRVKVNEKIKKKVNETLKKMEVKKDGN